jgi:hypothetical protein
VDSGEGEVWATAKPVAPTQTKAISATREVISLPLVARFPPPACNNRGRTSVSAFLKELWDDSYFGLSQLGCQPELRGDS